MATATAGAAPPPFLDRLGTISQLASTVPTSAAPRPGDGDVNPYGVAVIPTSIGRLTRGDVLVSNFNDAANSQGTGRTIVEVSPAGHVRTFARLPEVPGGVGLTTALAVLPDGFVVVGNLPTTDGMSDTAAAGGLLILSSDGRLVDNLTGGDINGPWDLTATSYGDRAILYVTNVLNGTVAGGGDVVAKGTVVRLTLELRHDDPKVVGNTVIASGLAERTDPAALVVGPTGVGLSANGTLYVADTVHSTIRAIPAAPWRMTSAGPGRVVTTGGALNGPLGLVVAQNGDIVTTNGGDGLAVETTSGGSQVATRSLDSSGSPPGSGALFGLAVRPGVPGLYFVDDATNELDLLHP